MGNVCRLAIVLALASVCHPVAAASAGDLWQVTSTMSMQGMPSAMPAATPNPTPTVEPLLWTQARLDQDWPAPVRPEPPGGPMVVPLGKDGVAADPAGDTPYLDVDLLVPGLGWGLAHSAAPRSVAFSACWAVALLAVAFFAVAFLAGTDLAGGALAELFLAGVILAVDFWTGVGKVPVG